MISTHLFEPWHVDELGAIVSELSNIEENKDFIRGFSCGPNHHAFTIAEGNTPIGIIGGTFRYPKVMEVFALLSEDIKKSPLGFHKEVKRIINCHFDDGVLNRMQMEVRADHPKAFDWAMSLGFKVEGTMKNYGLDNTDYYLFARYQ